MRASAGGGVVVAPGMNTGIVPAVPGLSSSPSPTVKEDEERTKGKEEVGQESREEIAIPSPPAAQDLHPMLQHFFPARKGVFQDDRAPIHRAHVYANWFDEHETDGIHTTRPSLSPDLNPIKHLWNILE